MKTIYKSTTDYRTDNGTFTVEHTGTLSANLSAIENQLKNLKILSANTYHKPMVLNVTDKFLSIFNDN